MPKGAEFIIRSLENAGFEAYIVGGCVRDGILGRDPEDWDITTIAKPDEIKRIFSHTVDTGIEHGTVTVLVPPEEVERGIRSFEVTTYRIDGEYTDHRHPNAVSFTGSLEEDLARRDFTINAMAYHMERGIIDPFHGQEDLEKKIFLRVKNMNAKTLVSRKLLVRQAMIAAIYAVLTWMIPSLSYGPIQFRISEVMTLLAFFNPEYIVGLTVGCAISNLLSSLGMIDVVVGTLASFLALTAMSKIKNIWIASLMPAVFSVLIGLEIVFISPEPVSFIVVTAQIMLS